MKKITLLNSLKKNPFILAPMAGITDFSFRSFMKKMNAGILVSELVSATGLEYQSKKTQALMRFDENQHPIGIQLFGENPQHMSNAAKLVQDLGADFVDVNFGCPVPKVVKKGAGSAMLKNLPAMALLLREMVAAVDIPVTIKIRLGWDSESINAKEVAQLAYDQGITWVAIHGRTRAQGYEGLADWDKIAEVKASSKIPIIGNGDIQSSQQAFQKLKDFNVDGVMIGRGALKNPWIFQESICTLNNLPRPQRDYVSLFKELHSILLAHCDDHIVQIQLKKLASWFSTGYPGASHFRKNIFQTHSVNEIMSAALIYFETINEIQQQDTSEEAFLMGGHG